MIPKFFGQYLLEKRAIDADQLLKAIEYQKNYRHRLGEIALEQEYLSEEQIKQVHQEQRQTDMLFGELAVKMDLLDKKQLEEIITIQKNSHVYIGEALVATGALTKDRMEASLKHFQEEQKEVKAEEFILPFKHKYSGIISDAIDLIIKLFLRIGDITAKPGQIDSREKETDALYANVIMQFAGDFECRLLFCFSKEAVHQIAKNLFEEEIEDEKLILENTGEFLNVICGNLRTKLEMQGKKTTLSVPKIITEKEQAKIKYAEKEKAAVVPLNTTFGQCEVQFLVSEVEMGKSTTKKVMIVDDSESLAYRLTRVINQIEGFEVVKHVKTAKEAINAYAELRPDLVTMDIILPDMSGIETIKQIKKIDPDSNIVVISSIGGGQETLFEAIKLGARNVITKPFNKESLKEIFEQSV